jgi:hypothetical protein
MQCSGWIAANRARKRTINRNDRRRALPLRATLLPHLPSGSWTRAIRRAPCHLSACKRELRDHGASIGHHSDNGSTPSGGVRWYRTVKSMLPVLMLRRRGRPGPRPPLTPLVYSATFVPEFRDPGHKQADRGTIFDCPQLSRDQTLAYIDFR